MAVVGGLSILALFVGITFCLLGAMKRKRISRRNFRLAMTGLLLTLASLLGDVLLAIFMYAVSVANTRW